MKADVAGARVLINGEDKGAAPLDNVMLPAGSYETVEINLRPEAVAQTDKPL